MSLPSWLGRRIISKIKPHVIDLWTEHPILSTVLTTSLVTLIVYFFIRRRQKRIDNFQNVLARKQQERQVEFSNLRSKFKMSKEMKVILSLEWTVLVEGLQTKKLKASQVLAAFIAKSLEVDCNAVTEFNPRAMEIAEKLDAMKGPKGLLHGIPFCVKDDTDIQGMDSTLGLAKNCFKPKSESAVLVQILENLGAVPFCKTNVPQTLLSFGSDNPIFGMTTSCHNKKLSAGGSSSGTGALVGSLGCFFGVGTDTGGSMRIPAHFNGVSTLKPTAGRVSIKGISAALPYLIGLEPTSGIIGRNAQVVADIYKLILQNNIQYKLDPKVIPLPFNEKVFSSKQKLRIGYFTHLPLFPPIGDTVETVEKAVTALRTQGHTLVPIEMPCGSKVMRVAGNYLFADQFRELSKLLEGEELAECSKANKIIIKCPTIILKLVASLMKQKWLPWIYSRTLAVFTDAGALKSASLWDNKEEQEKIIQQVFTQWRKLNLDCAICPVMPCPAIHPKLPSLLPMATVYTMMFNVLNFPAGVVQFGKESGKFIDQYDDQGDQALKLCKKACKESIGSPIGIQVFSLPWNEENVLRIMKELEK